MNMIIFAIGHYATRHHSIIYQKSRVKRITSYMGVVPIHEHVPSPFKHRFCLATQTFMYFRDE